MEITSHVRRLQEASNAFLAAPDHFGFKFFRDGLSVWAEHASDADLISVAIVLCSESDRC